MSILQQAPTKYSVTPEQVKALIAADLGVPASSVTVQLITRQGPMVDSIRGEYGAPVFD